MDYRIKKSFNGNNFNYLDSYQNNYGSNFDRSSVNSWQEGSLNSELDDLTVIADFDKASVQEEVEEKEKKKKKLNKQTATNKFFTYFDHEREGRDQASQIDDGYFSRYSTRNEKALSKPSWFDRSDLNSLSSFNLSETGNHSNQSTLQKIVDRNQMYDFEEQGLDGLVLNNSMREKSLKNKKSQNSVQNDLNGKKNLNTQTSHSLKDSKNLTSQLNNKIDGLDREAGKGGFLNNRTTKDATSFYVPLDNETDFYQERKPSQEILNIKYTQIEVKEKGVNTEPEKKKKSKEDKKTMTDKEEAKKKINVAMVTEKTKKFNVSTTTDNLPFQNFEESEKQKVKIISENNELKKELDGYLKENKELIDQLMEEMDRREEKNRLYEDLVKEHELVKKELESSYENNDKLKKKAELSKPQKSILLTSSTQTIFAEEKNVDDKLKLKNILEEENLEKISNDFKKILNHKEGEINNLKHEVQNLELELEQVRSESEKHKIEKKENENKIEQVQNLVKEINELKQETESLKKKNKNLLNNDDPNFKGLKEALFKIEEEKKLLEKSSLETNKKMQEVLEETLEDLKKAEKKIETLNYDNLNKEGKIRNLEKLLEEEKEIEKELKKVINDLKEQLETLGNKMSDVSLLNLEQQNKEQFVQTEHEEELLKEISRLMKINSELNQVILINKSKNMNEGELWKKYNDLRELSSKLQTSLSPLKAKLSLANKKCREKNDLLEVLLRSCKENKRIPEALEKKVEVSLKDDEHYRPLSPLTITYIDRLEHNLFSHLYDQFPESSYRRTKSVGNLLEEENMSTTNLLQEKLKTPNQKTTRSTSNLKLFSLFDQPELSLYDSFKQKNLSPVELQKPPDPKNLLYRRNPILIDSPSQKPHFSCEQILIKSLKKDLLGEQKNPNNSFRSLNRNFSQNSKSPQDSYSQPFMFSRYHEVPPPRNFQIDKILNKEKFLFCWEPPLLHSEASPIVGYEFFINGKKEDTIKDKNQTSYCALIPSLKSFPSTFSLHSLSVDGKISLPSEIILHGLKNVPRFKDTEIRKDKSSFKLNSSLENHLNTISESKRRMFMAFYDYNSTGFEMERDGKIFNDLSFQTGEFIETFGDVLPNGYIFGKIRGKNKLGLIPANFLEKINK